MGLGFGALKQMSDSFKYNRDLLGKKKSVRDIYKDEIKKRGTTSDNQNLEFVRQRVAKALKRNRIKELLAKVIAAITLVALVTGVILAAMTIDFTPTKKNKYADKSGLFNTIIYDHSNGLKLKTDAGFGVNLKCMFQNVVRIRGTILQQVGFNISMRSIAKPS